MLERIQKLAGDSVLLQKLTEQTNERLLKQKPALEKQKQALQKSLGEVKNQANKILESWLGIAQKGDDFVKEKLAELSSRWAELENELGETERAIRQIQEQTVKGDDIRQALARITEIYGQLKPFERRELMGTILKSARVNEREIILEIYGMGESGLNGVNQGQKVCTGLNWLLG